MSGRDPGDALRGLACPRPADSHAKILMAHGGGGRLTQRLIETVLLDAFRNDALAALHDGAVLRAGSERIAFTTDSYVVRPIFFPGGDIGSLSVHGTVNDLAMCGAMPLALSCGLILEEGFLLDDLRRVVGSIGAAASAAGVPVATGDTKVVDRGKGDGIYVNTAGIGIVPDGVTIDPRRARPGDAVLLSGPIAEHGVAILSVREGLSFDSEIRTDSAALHRMVAGILVAGGEAVHVLRDPTRGGVASALNEIAGAAGIGVLLDESAIPVRDDVRGACEMLGLDPLYVANEGKCLAFVAPGRAERVLEAMRSHPEGAGAARIGTVTAEPGRVVLRSRIGGQRVVAMLSGEQLPRIC